MKANEMYSGMRVRAKKVLYPDYIYEDYPKILKEVTVKNVVFDTIGTDLEFFEIEEYEGHFRCQEFEPIITIKPFSNEDLKSILNV